MDSRPGDETLLLAVADRMFPAPGTGGQSPDHVWWTVLAVCVVAIAISVGGRSLPRWMSSVPGEATP